MARLLGGELMRHARPRNGRIGRLLRTLDPLDRLDRRADTALLVIARTPRDATADALPRALVRCYRTIAVWIVDAFVHERIPPVWRFGPYDVIAVTRPNDVDIYRRRFGDRIIQFPWGTDALGLGTGTPDRAVDVLRVGRQPPAWDDDAASAEACAERNLVFMGRPPSLDDPLDSHAALLRCMAGARFLVAHSNLAAPAPYTHPTQAYVTARWTDALAAGCVVAGVPPWEDASTNTLWPEALLPFEEIDLASNVALLAEAKACWSSLIPLRNHREALARLDWRWRIRDLARRLGVVSEPLEAELRLLRKRIADLDRELAARGVC